MRNTKGKQNSYHNDVINSHELLYNPVNLTSTYHFIFSEHNGKTPYPATCDGWTEIDMAQHFCIYIFLIFKSCEKDNLIRNNNEMIESFCSYMLSKMCFIFLSCNKVQISDDEKLLRQYQNYQNYRTFSFFQKNVSCQFFCCIFYIAYVISFP